MPKPVFERWINAISRGDIGTIEEIFEDDSEMLTEYASRIDHGVSIAGLNSAHLAVYHGQARVLRWISERCPDILDLATGDQANPADLAKVGFMRKKDPTVQETERYIDTFMVLGYERTRTVMPEVLRRTAELAWRDRGNGCLTNYERRIELLAEMLESVRDTAGATSALEAGLNISGLPPFWDLLRRGADSEQETLSWTERAARHALANHPSLDARCFFEFIAPEVAVNIRENPSILDEAWRTGDYAIARFLIRWIVQDEGVELEGKLFESALSHAIHCDNIQVVHALLAIGECASSHLPFRYLLWNLALGRATLAGAQERSSNNFRLYYTPRSLWYAWHQLFPGLSMDEAEADILEAAAQAYRLGGLKGFAGTEEGFPRSIAFLTASIIAASRMNADEGVHAGNYYARLGDILGFGLTEPPEFERPLFRALWQEVAGWLSPLAILCLPPEGYRAIPLSHVLLRQVDIRRLDRYFDARGFTPQASLTGESLTASFHSWAAKHSLSVPAQQALDDGRMTAVLRQVSLELSRWDGSVREVTNTGITASRSVSIDYHLYRTGDGRYEFYFSAPCPPGFPEVFPDILGIPGTSLESDGFDRYCRVRISDGSSRDISSKIVDGFNSSLGVDGRRLRLNSAGRKALVFRLPEDDAAWKNTQSMPLNSTCLIMCHGSVEDEVLGYLEAACGAGGFRQASQQVLPGWTLFANVLVKDPSIIPPPALSALQAETDVETRFVGGLRLGRAFEWLDGSPPTVAISGAYREVKINGIAVDVEAGGLVQLDRLGLAPGPVVVSIDGAATEICLVEPRMHETTQLQYRHEAEARVLYPLIPGDWALLGNEPGQFVLKRVPRRAGHHAAGQIVRLSFPVAWILDQSGSPRVYAACDGRTGPTPSDVGAILRAGDWAHPLTGAEGTEWFDLVTSRREQFRKGRFSAASQREVEKRWAEFASRTPHVPSHLASSNAADPATAGRVTPGFRDSGSAKGNRKGRGSKRKK